MSELRCPCGHLVFHELKEKGHGVNGCLHGWPVALDCDCTLDTAQALRAAQRKAAIRHLRAYGRIYREALKEKRWDDASRWIHQILSELSAYRAVGILGQRKGGE